MSKRTTVPLSLLQAVGRLVKAGAPINSEYADMYVTAALQQDPAYWYPSNEPPDKTARILLRSGPTWRDRPAAVRHIQRKDLYISSAGVLHMTPVPHDDTTYRVSIFPDGVDVICFGIERVDSCLEGHYDGIDLLPNWVKERLAVLNMIDPTPPTATVEGVGRRISAHVYWVHAPTTAEASTSA